MVFKSNRQRRAVMAKMRRSVVQPQIGSFVIRSKKTGRVLADAETKREAEITATMKDGVVFRKIGKKERFIFSP